MPPFRPLLLVSVALNVALAAAFILGALSPSPSSVPPAPRPALNSPPRPATPPAIDPATWSRLTSDVASGASVPDFPALVARLRTAGFPPSVIRGIVTSLLKNTFDARRRALDTTPNTRPFWQNPRAPDPELQRALHELDREYRSTLFALLGSDATDPNPIALLRRRSQLADLSPERSTAVSAIMDRYDRLRTEVPGPEGHSSADYARYAALDEEQRTAIAQLLTPAELAAYDLRTSSAAAGLRSRLALFEPSEREFLALYQLRRSTDEEIKRAASLPAADQAKLRSDAEQKLKEQLPALLGPERAADYERTTDFNYRQTAQLVSRLALPPTVATELWSVQRDTQQRAEALLRDHQLTPAQRTAQLTALAAEATTRATAILGPRTFTEYLNNGGNWLQRLILPPSP